MNNGGDEFTSSAPGLLGAAPLGPMALGIGRVPAVCEPAVFHSEDFDSAHLLVVVFRHGHVPHGGDGGFIRVSHDAGDLDTQLLDTDPDTLPAFLRLFQARPWNGTDSLPATLLDQIRNRTLVANKALAFEGCPFVGLDAFRIDQAQLFFGRQQETLDALACFDTRRGHATVRWLEINGNSGSGKSSLMNAGLLPLVDQGWLWPRTGYAVWQRIA